MIDLLDNPLFKIPFFGGLFFILPGFILFYFPPKKINSLYGYRTISSMKSQKRWDFAQRFSAREMMKSGGLLTVCSLLVFITDFNNSINLIIGLSLIILIVISLFVRVESAIKAKFRN